MDALQAIKATPIAIENGTRTPDAFQLIIHACLQQAAGNMALISDEMPDAVHQARIGLRRTRSGLALFKRFLNKKERKWLNSALRDAGRHLAACRDWDVFIADTLPRMRRRFPELSLDRIHDYACQQQRSAYATLAEHKSALNDLISSANIGFDAEREIETDAAELLDRVHLRVRRACRHVRTAEDRHTLRKAMKPLRYSVEFLASLYDAKDVRAYLSHCKETQEILGSMNDACTTIALLEKLGQPHPTLIAWANGSQDKAFSHLAKAIAEFRSAKPYWD